MRQISASKRMQVIRLFLDGLPYEQIGRKAKVSKGSVVNIVDELKQGIYPEFEDLGEKVDALRELSADLRKSELNVYQAQAGAALFRRLQDLGIDPRDVEIWIGVCRTIAPEDQDSRRFIHAGLELMKLEGQLGMSHEEVLEEHRRAALEVDRMRSQQETLKAEQAKARANYETERQKLEREVSSMRGAIADLREGYAQERERLDAEARDHIARHNLTLENVDLVLRIVSEEFAKKGFGDEGVAQIKAGIKEAGSLQARIAGLQFSHLTLSRERDTLSKEVKELSARVSDLEAECHALLRERKAKEAQVRKLDRRIHSRESLLAELTEKRDAVRIDIDVTTRWIIAIANPGDLSNWDLDRFVDEVVALRQARTGVGQKVVRDSAGNVLCRCPLPFSFMSGVGSEEKVTERMVELLLPLVRDRFVERSAHEALRRSLEQAEETANSERNRAEEVSKELREASLQALQDQEKARREEREESAQHLASLSEENTRLRQELDSQRAYPLVQRIDNLRQQIRTKGDAPSMEKTRARLPELEPDEDFASRFMRFIGYPHGGTKEVLTLGYRFLIGFSGWLRTQSSVYCLMATTHIGEAIYALRGELAKEGLDTEEEVSRVVSVIKGH